MGIELPTLKRRDTSILMLVPDVLPSQSWRQNVLGFIPLPEIELSFGKNTFGNQHTLWEENSWFCVEESIRLSIIAYIIFWQIAHQSIGKLYLQCSKAIRKL